jgi:hypothetical protein
LAAALRLPLSIAADAGALWRTRARTALRELAGVSGGGGMSERLHLLTDIKAVFEFHDTPAKDGKPAVLIEELATIALLEGLIALDESPWRGWWAKEDGDGEVRVAKGAARRLSTHLKPLNVKSKQIGPTELRRKGYLREDFEPVWERYLPKDPATGGPESAQSAHSASQSQKTAPQIRSDDETLSGFEPSENGSTEPSERIERIEPADNGSEADYAARFKRDQDMGAWGR